MEIAENSQSLRELVQRATRPCVLVPTMGSLHAGHLALMERARETAGPNGTVIVSIFVNPIQFNRQADLEAYPRPLTSDLAQCEATGVDIVFTPTAESMYHSDRSVKVTESSLSNGLCGATRPGHFDGVCTVVLKLFLLTGCEAAVFGEKDFQQLAIIRRMVRDLSSPVEIISVPTVREADGLAMSSRNVRLSPEQRRDAPRIQAALLAGAKQLTVKLALATARAHIEATLLTRIDYLTLVDAVTLEETDHLTTASILATAVFYDSVRLIDHVKLCER